MHTLLDRKITKASCVIGFLLISTTSSSAISQQEYDAAYAKYIDGFNHTAETLERAKKLRIRVKCGLSTMIPDNEPLCKGNLAYIKKATKILNDWNAWLDKKNEALIATRKRKKERNRKILNGLNTVLGVAGAVANGYAQAERNKTRKNTSSGSGKVYWHQGHCHGSQKGCDKGHIH